MRTNCKFYESRTYATGESVRKCDLDLAPEAPWRCPENCPGFKPRMADVGWSYGSLQTDLGPPRPEGFDESAAAGKDKGKIVLNVGETYPMKIIKLSPAERKIGLSIRALKSDEFHADWQEYQEGAGDGSATLGDHFRNR